jgi:hypothetical protein
MKEQFLYELGDVVTVPTTIAILGGNSVAGRALEALLHGVGYDTRLIEDPPERSPEQLLEGVRLLLLAPTLSAESRETLLTDMGSTLDATNIPVLTLSTSLKEALAERPAFIPWPCRLEDLTKKIEAVLLRAPKVGGAQAPAGT